MKRGRNSSALCGLALKELLPDLGRAAGLDSYKSLDREKGGVTKSSFALSCQE